MKNCTFSCSYNNNFCGRYRSVASVLVKFRNNTFTKMHTSYCMYFIRIKATYYSRFIRTIVNMRRQCEINSSRTEVFYGTLTTFEFQRAGDGTCRIVRSLAIPTSTITYLNTFSFFFLFILPAGH